MLWLLPTPIGNLLDISLRTLWVLQRVDVLLCEDTRVTKSLLELLRKRHNLTTKPNLHLIPFHSHNEAKVLNSLDTNLLKTKEVAYLSDAGMPSISDPGAKLVEFAQQNSIAYDVLPGANALLSAFVASGFDAKEFWFVGFLPHKGQERTKKLKECLQSSKVAILYESPHRLTKLLEEIEALAPKKELFLAKELTKLHQRYFRGYAKELLKEIGNSIKGEWVVVMRGEDENGTKSLMLTKEEIIALELPKRQKAKLLARFGDRSAKEYYELLYLCSKRFILFELLLGIFSPLT